MWVAYAKAGSYRFISDGLEFSLGNEEFSDKHVKIYFMLMWSLQNRKLVLLWKLFNDDFTWAVIALGFLVLDQGDYSGMTYLLFFETQTPAVCIGLPRVFFSSEALLTGWNVSMSVSHYSNLISSQCVSVLLSYQYNDVLYSEAAEMFAELSTVLKKKKSVYCCSMPCFKHCWKTP